MDLAGVPRHRTCVCTATPGWSPLLTRVALAFPPTGPTDHSLLGAPDSTRFGLRHPHRSRLGCHGDVLGPPAAFGYLHLPA